jgi:hypothetical protein
MITHLQNVKEVKNGPKKCCIEERERVEKIKKKKFEKKFEKIRFEYMSLPSW